MAPSRNDDVTAYCLACGTELGLGGRRYCSDACRQAGFRRRHQPQLLQPPPLPARQPRRPVTVYECPDCGQRQVGDQRCADCSTFMSRVGLGGACPHCDEPVTINDLLPGTKGHDMQYP